MPDLDANLLARYTSAAAGVFINMGGMRLEPQLEIEDRSLLRHAMASVAKSYQPDADPSTETEQLVDVTRDQLMQLLDYGAEITLTGQVSSATLVCYNASLSRRISWILTIMPHSRPPSL